MSDGIKVGDRVIVKDATRAQRYVGMTGLVVNFSTVVCGVAIVALDACPAMPVAFAVENLELVIAA